MKKENRHNSRPDYSSHHSAAGDLKNEESVRCSKLAESRRARQQRQQKLSAPILRPVFLGMAAAPETSKHPSTEMNHPRSLTIHTPEAGEKELDQKKTPLLLNRLTRYPEEPKQTAAA